MKTVDLIPLILLELQDDDKYGFELTKNIETKSSGKIIIKQPTLYTLLKKLEKSKFISSYWQDSEIGGKRHYYRLTENGKLQASTLPSYEELLSGMSPFDSNLDDIQHNNQISSHHIEPLETIIPTEEVFDNSQGQETELSINISNLEVIKDEKPEEKFAENKSVETFTQKVNFNSNIEQINNFSIDDKFKSVEQKQIFEISEKKSKHENFIRFNDYIDFKTNLEYQKQKSIVKKNILISFLISLTMLSLIIISFFATFKYGRSVIFYIYSAISSIIVIACPMSVIAKSKKTNNHSQNTKNHHLKIYLSITFILMTLIISIVVSLMSGMSTISEIVKLNNFANLYAPLLMSSIGFIELLYRKLFISKK